MSIDAFLFVAAFAGGALNAIAGGGSFLTLPALLSAGIAPVTANATSTLAMWPAALASAVMFGGTMMGGPASITIVARQQVPPLLCLPLTCSQLRKQFLRNKDVNDVRTIDMLVIKACSHHAACSRARAALTSRRRRRSGSSART